MSRRKLVTRRFQQTFIIAAILSIALVIACGDQWYITVQNDLNQDIEIRIKPLYSTKENVQIGQPIEVFGTTKVAFDDLLDIEFFDGGPRSAEKYSVLLAADSENYFFWVINDALLEARCVVVVSEAMTNFLEPFGITGDPITGSPFLIDDPLILNPNYQEFPLNRCDDHQGADEEQ